MPQRRLHRLALAIAVSASDVSAGAAAEAEAVVSPQQPTVLGEVYRVDATSGALLPLEVVKTGTEGGLRSWYTYLPGAASTIAFSYGEPLVFATCDLVPPEVQLKGTYYRIERLAVKDGKRYATKQFLPLDVRTYGPPIPGLDENKKKNRPAYAYLYTPRQTLPPGEYVLTVGGVTSSEGHFGTKEQGGGAFRVVETPRPAQPAAATPAAPGQVTGPRPNTAADIERLRSAAEGGEAAAQVSLAGAYATGNGVPQDYLQTNQWLRKAADRGSADARYWLAVMYRDAVGVAPDQAQAGQLFRQAAEQGHPQAQANLGSLHFFGRGVVQDYIEAHKWLNVASSRLEGDERRQCVELRDKVAALMTPVQLAEAQKRAVEWAEAFQKRAPQGGE